MSEEPTASTLKLDGGLRTQIRELALAQSTSPHAWMIRAIRNEVQRAQAYGEFEAQALASLEAVEQGEKVRSLAQVRRSLMARRKSAIA
jgi:predicted transcriptional regulator